MARVRHIPATLLIVAAAAAAGGCASTGSGSSAGATAPSTPGVTVTRTVTTKPPAPPPTSPRAQTPAPPQTRPAAADAATVVADYFAAINARDYATAWALGGKNVSSSYASFVQGFAGTAQDSIQILNATPSTATVALDAVQTDGSVRSFEGTYTVTSGVITGARVHAVAGARPGASTPGNSGAYDNCSDAHADGACDIPSSDPRYRAKLDRDHDGFACEPYESEQP